MTTEAEPTANRFDQMSEKFISLSQTEKETFLKNHAALLPAGYDDPGRIEIHRTAFAFYPEWRFYQFERKNDMQAPPVHGFVRNDDLILMDWRPETVYRLNEQAPLSLTSGNICDYVRFFFTHTRTPSGQMKIIESPDDFNWREDPPMAVRKALSSLIQPLKVVMWDEEENLYQVSGNISFKGNLFDVVLQIDSAGKVEIADRTIQVEDIPLLDEISGL